MYDSIIIPLDIEGVKVNRVEITSHGEVHIHVISTVEGTCCHRCGRETREFYDYSREIKLRHLPILGKPTYIFLKPRRYVCRHCSGHPTTTQRLPWYEPRCSTTRAYEEQILKSLVNSTVYDVSEKEGLGYATVEDILARHRGTSVNWETLIELPTLGIDELAIKKGHRDFVTVVSVHRGEGQNQVLGILEGRDKATVKAFLQGIPKRLRQTVHTVCSDLYEGYTEAAREVFGEKVVITADRFHVAKLYRTVVDKVRKAEMRRLKQELPEDEYGRLEGALWVVRKDPYDLDDAERATLERLFEHSPHLKSVYLFAATLTALFEKPYTKTEAEAMFRAWMSLVRKTALPCFGRFLGTLEEKMDLITNYFVRRENSGFVEGLNHKIRVLLWRSYGMLNLTHLFQRLTLDLGGYAQFA